MGFDSANKAPAPPNYTGAAQAQADASKQNVNQQTTQNRPDQYNPFGSSTWSTGPDGRPIQTTSLDPGDQSRLDAFRQQQLGMYGQANDLMGGLHDLNQPTVDFGRLGPIGTGDQARQQAISAAYGQAQSRLDPRFQQEQNQLQSQLAGQGLDPTSEAYQTAMQNFGREKNDAYSSAMNGAIGQGTAAGSAIFNQNLAGHQAGAQDMLAQADFLRNNQRYNQGRQMSELGTLLGHEAGVGNPQFQQFDAAGQAQTPNLFGAAEAQGAYGLGATGINNAATAQDNKRWADLFTGLGQMAGGGVNAFSSGSNGQQGGGLNLLSLFGLI